MLLENIQNDLKEAMRSKDEAKVLTLRLLISEIKNTVINKQSLASIEGKSADLSDQEIISIIQKEVKKRNESIASFRSGGREDLANKEQIEANVLQTYLPSQLSDEDLLKIIKDTIKELGAVSISDMGKVIGSVIGKVQGQADGGRISQLVKKELVGG